MIKKILLSPWTALLTFGVLLGIKISDPYLVEATRLKFYDYLMLSEQKKSEQIVLINIGEKSIEKYGQYPFPRKVYADINSEVYGRGTALVGSTILFPEPDRMGTDGVLADSLKQYPVVLSQIASDDCKQTGKQNPRPAGIAVIGDGQPTEFLPRYPCVLGNIPSLQASAVGVGITSTLPEADGVVRRVPLLSQSSGEYYPSFAVEMLRVAAGDSSYQAKINQTGVEALRVPSFETIKTDEYGRVFINPNYQFQSYEIGAGPLPDLSGKIAIVGVTAAGLSNPVATPSGAQYPHQLQASILETLINGDSVSIPNWVPLVDLGGFLLLFLALVVISRFKFSYVYIAVLIAAYIYLPVYLFGTYGIILDISFNVIATLLIYMHVYTVKFISEYLQKQQIKKQFGTYLSPDMVEKLQKNPELLKLGGESRELSIMFTDVRGFTTISEHYGEDVQGLTKIMNRYMTAMTKRIIDNKGTLDKYIGDAQMAFWNAPLDDPDHAKNAVRTAMDMLKDLEAFNAEIEKEGIPAFGMGLGINTATVVVGNMGSDQRFDYTCLGDGVNLASRLEGQSKPYGVKLVTGPVTADMVRDVYQVVELDLIAVKGKTEPARIYTVLEEFDEVGEKQHKKFLELYRQGKWDMAIRFARDLQYCWNGQLNDYYRMMEQRIFELKFDEPLKWDGVYRATSK